MISSVFSSIPRGTVTLMLAMLSLVTPSAPGQTQCVETNGYKVAFPPNIDGGLDVLDSQNNIVLADDFPCTSTGPVSDIHIWGSWLGNNKGTITNFWLAIYSDVPAVTNFASGQITPSHPNVLLWQQSFGPGQFVETVYGSGSESFYDPSTGTFPGSDTQAYYYCFYPTNAFPQQGTAAKPTNYWLVAYAQVAGGAPTIPVYGWKTTLTPYNDGAVWGHYLPTSGQPIGDWQTITNSQTLQPINLAFALTTPTNTLEITCPTNIIAYTCASNAVVTWTVTATGSCGTLTVTSIPPSGTSFPVNSTTPVQAIASNACGITNCYFLVTVLRDPNCPSNSPVVCVESDFDKYVQSPNIFGGFDVLNNPYVLADDFVCTNTGPLSDIHLWGSWLNDQAITNSITFWLGIYDDVPVGPGNTFSHPGTNLLWQQSFLPGQYAETIWTNNAQELFLDPGSSNALSSDSVVWYYCFYPTNAFQQTGTTNNAKTYWLAAYAQFPVGASKYGWKTTTTVLKDTSVHAIWPGSPPIADPGWTPTAERPPTGGPAVPLDLAFKLTMCGPITIHWLPPTNVVVTWLGAGYLQSATNVSGPYVDVPSFPTSPFTDYAVSPTNKFYRLRCY